LPTYDRAARFNRDYASLSRDEPHLFLTAVGKFVADLSAGRGFRPGLRVKGVQGHPGVFELTWSDDGRATFSFGRSIRETEPHVIWRRVGTHDVLRNP